MDQENRLIKIEELEIGDEILTSSNGHLRYLKVMRKPKLSKKHTSRYVPVKCLVNCEVENKIHSWTDYQKVVHNDHYTVKKFICDNEFKIELPFQLNWRDIWLVRRERV